MSSKTLYIEPAKVWTEAQPLGNGSIGAMVYGGICKEKVCLNHDTLWSGRPEKIQITGAYEALKKAKELTLAGDYAQAHELITKNCLGKKSESYLTFGTMNLDFINLNGEVSDYTRELDLENALLSVKFSVDGVAYERKYFVSYPNDCLVVKLSADVPGRISFDLGLSSPLMRKTGTDDGAIWLEGECPGSSTKNSSGEICYHYSDVPEEKGVAFRGAVKALVDGSGSSLEIRSDSISGSMFHRMSVRNADSCVLLLSIKTSFNGYDKYPAIEGREYVNALHQTLQSAQMLGYEELLKRHKKDYSRLFGQVSLDLGSSGREDMPTDERLEKFKQDKDDISLYTLLFDFGRYLAISSVRESSQVANLQGIWNDSMTPPWLSNFTLNINLQMNQWPLLVCGLEECFQPFIRFVQDASVSGEHAARMMYHADGFVMHSNTDIWLRSTPITGDARFAFWNGSSGWLCRDLYEYYEYTGDRKYLKEVCYPIMKKAALFYLDIICDRGDGVYSICPATSPENGFIYVDRDGVTRNAAVAKSATMSDTIACDLFTNCLNAIEELRLAEDVFKNRLEVVLAKMHPFVVGSDGRLLEWNEEFDESEVDHRHVSHLYGLHPANMITPAKTPELARACKKTLERRGDGGTGWSLAWKANFYARLREGDHALKLIDMMLNPVDSQEISYEAKGGIYPNLFDAHPPFQIDGNFGVCAAIAQMLIQDNDGVELLPALPKSWKNGSFRNFRVRGNKRVSCKWENGKVIEFVR